MGLYYGRKRDIMITGIDSSRALIVEGIGLPFQQGENSVIPIYGIFNTGHMCNRIEPVSAMRMVNVWLFVQPLPT
jgi:hypothetical protein